MKLERLTGWATALMVAVAIAVAGCGGDAPEGTGLRTAADIDTGLEHVHAVGVDPADAAVMIATHAGLFRLGNGESTPVRVGELQQDTMGFTVVGPGRYLGSGHPDLRTDLPASLGLIASDDGGHTWESVSLLGEADFHILRARGARVVGVDSHTGDIFTSDNRGRTWTRRTPPAELVDLVIDPGRTDAFVASTQTGLLTSRDAGATWTARGGGPGYLAWPARDVLYRVGTDGTVRLSADGGRTWTVRTALGTAPAALAAIDRTRVLVATHDRQLLESLDGARTWTTRAALR